MAVVVRTHIAHVTKYVDDRLFMIVVNRRIDLFNCQHEVDKATANARNVASGLLNPLRADNSYSPPTQRTHFLRKLRTSFHGNPLSYTVPIYRMQFPFVVYSSPLSYTVPICRMQFPFVVCSSPLSYTVPFVVDSSKLLASKFLESRTLRLLIRWPGIEFFTL